jgi:C-terminal processing protease CtpA/Prc
MNMEMLLKKIVILTFVTGSFGVACQSKTGRQVQNLESFARLYGYARWFHPSDEAQEIDWDRFAVLGVRKVENVKSSAALRDTLYQLFSPIVQGLQIYDARKPEIFHPEVLSSPDPDAKPVAWQHYGVYLNDKSNIYKSIRTGKSKIDKTVENAIVGKYLPDSLQLKGKEVKFSGYFRSSKGGAKLVVQPITSSGNDKRHEALIKSHDWKRYELTLTVPREARGMMYGFENNGDVEVWVDDFTAAVSRDGKWEPVDTVNMGFERGKSEDEANPVDNWTTFMRLHTAEVTDENPYSGKYCLKVSYTGKMFERMPQLGEITKAPIGNDLICVVPLTLLSCDTLTCPRTDPSTLARLQSELSNIGTGSGFDPQVNLASVIIAWNVLQHFFPYFDVIDADWNKVLGETLESTLANRRKKDFFITLSQMIAQIDDGHGGIVYGEQMYHLPIRTEYIENKIVITASDNAELKRGDIIRKIDRKPVMKALDEKEKMISGSPQLRRHRALNILGSKLDPGETRLVIERDGKKQTVTVAASKRGNMFLNPVDEWKYLSETVVEIEPGIYYVNMNKCTENEFEQKKEILAHAKAVIYDQRGGGGLNFFQIVPYLIEAPVTSAWWNVPQTVYPDRKEVAFSESNWDIQPKQPLFKSRSIIINVPSVVSSGETMMGIIDHYKLATTAGEPTAGCNGNINTINMPCGYYAWFTGMKVLKHDGSQLYLKGFEPDCPVKRTIRAIREERDEYLEAALEAARQE